MMLNRDGGGDDDDDDDDDDNLDDDYDDDVEPGWRWWFARLCRPVRLAVFSSVFSTAVRIMIGGG